MNKKGVYSSLLNDLQKQLSRFFRNNEFKKYNRTYNKSQRDGLVHVINFQLGEYPIGNYVIPGIRDTLYGKFAINLGVYIPIIDHIEKHYKINMKNGIKEYECEIRERLKPNKHKTDYWIDLPNDISKTGNHVQEIIETEGFAFLEQFRSIDDIIKYYEKYGEIPFNSDDRSTFSIALIHYGLGNKKKFDEYCNKLIKDCTHKGFVEHIKKVCDNLINSIV